MCERLHPGLIRGRTVDRGHLRACEPEVDRELPAVMDLILHRHPQDLRDAEVPHLPGPERELDGLVELIVAQLRNLGHGVVGGLLYPAADVVAVARRGPRTLRGGALHLARPVADPLIGREYP